MARDIEVGASDGLKVRIEWASEEQTQTASDITRGGILLWVDNHLTWGYETTKGQELFEWTWIELLEWLTDSWPYLVWEEGYPLSLRPYKPSELRDSLKPYLSNLPEGVRDEEENEVFEFEERHDLSRSLQGVTLPSLWIVREGESYWVVSDNCADLRPASEVLDQLAALGNAIRDRVAKCSDERSRMAIESWNSRHSRSNFELARIATGLPEGLLSRVLAIDPVFNNCSQPHTFHPTEILVAARMMAGQLSPGDMEVALKELASASKSPTKEIDLLTSEAESVVNPYGLGLPWAQGQVLATWFRQAREIPEFDPVNPADIFNEMKIPVRDFTIEEPRLDAMACWGPRLGPAVFVNTNGKHSRGPEGRRATLAHELCHLLIDRNVALPVSEVLNGQAPKRIEARANAFAAELLLPQKAAAGEFSRCADVLQAVEVLRQKFRVSCEIAAWQIRNSGANLSPEEKVILRRMTSNPEAF